MYFAEGPTGSAFLQVDILVFFAKKSRAFLAKKLDFNDNLRFCYNLSLKVKEFLLN